MNRLIHIKDMNEKHKQIMLMAAIIAANKSGCYKELIASEAISLAKEIYRQVIKE